MGSTSWGARIWWDTKLCLPYDKDGNRVTNYFKRLVPKGTKDPSTIRYHTMANVIDTLGNRSLLFIGDSVMGQISQDTECSWLRSTFWGEVPPKTVAYSESKPLPFHGEGDWRYKASHRKVTVRSRKGDFSEINHIFVYRPANDFSNAAEWIDEINPDAIFINFGLHYLIKEENLYTQMIRHLLTKLQPFALSKPLMFRETSAQHFNTDGGEYDTSPAPEWNISENLVKSCGPLRFVHHGISAESATSSDVLRPTIRKWRDRIVVREAKLLGYEIHTMDEYYLKEEPNQHLAEEKSQLTEYECKFLTKLNNTSPTLFIIPFYDWTESLWDVHDKQRTEGKCDATHFCSNPFVWEHVYD